MVVDTPTYISCSGCRAETPPTVFLATLVEHAEGVHHTAGFPLIEPCTLFGQEAAHADLSFGVIDVDGLVRDIIVAADYDIRTLLAQFVDPHDEVRQEVHLVFVFWSFGLARWDIDANNRHVAIVGTNDATLAVVFGITHTDNYAVGLNTCEDSYARIAFFLCGVDIALITKLLHGHHINLIGLRLALLYAKHIGLLYSQPVEEPLADGAADTIEVIGNDFHYRTIL